MGELVPHVPVSLFKYVTRSLVTELTWDLKSGRRRTGKALVRCLYPVLLCGVDWRPRQATEPASHVAEVLAKTGVGSGPHLSCPLWGTHGKGKHLA